MSYFERVLNVRKDELLPASLLSGYLMLVMGCYIMGKSVADSLFLSEYPNALSRIIAATAITIAVFISIYIRLSHRIPPHRLIPMILFFFSGSYLLFGVAAYFGQTWVYIPTYLWVYSAGVMCPTMGWTLANYALTTREARRVFGLIGAGPILGGACAGFLTAAIGKRIPTETLLLALALLQSVAVLPVRSLFRRVPHRMATLASASMAGDKLPRNFLQNCKLLIGSDYLMLITALIAVSCTCTTITDFQFKILASAHFAGDKESLSTFFGRFYGWMGMGAFLLQLVLTGRLLRNFGIRVTLFIMPVVLAAGSIGVLLVPSLVSALALRGGQHLLRYSVDKSSLELLHLPVSPELKAKLKPFIDTFVWRLADGVAGLILMLFSEGLGFAPSRLSLINIIFLAGWVVIANRARKGYLRLLKEAIQRRTLDPERTAAGILDQTTTQVLAGVLESNESREVLYGLSLFDLGRQPAWHPYLRALLDHPSAAVRQKALSLLCDGNDKDIVSKAEEMIHDESVDVRGEALRYLVVHTRMDPTELLMRSRLGVTDYSAQSSIILYLILHGSVEHREAAHVMLRQLLDQKGAGGRSARAAAARVLGLVPPPSPLHAALADLLRDEDPEVAEQALISAGRIRWWELLPGIIHNLARPRLAMAAVNALVEHGERILGTLHDCLNDDSVSPEVRHYIPTVLARIPGTASARILSESLVQGNPGLRYDILKALNRLRRHDPELVPTASIFEDLLRVELLGHYRSLQILAVLQPVSGRRPPPKDGEPLSARVLRERMSLELERIFLLLALIYPQRDILNAYHGLISRQPQFQANALEVLEHLLKPDTYRELIFAVDPEIALKQKTEFAGRFYRTNVKSKCEGLRILLHSEDRWLRISAVYELGEQRISDLLEDLQTMACEGDPILLETHKWAVERISADSPT